MAYHLTKITAEVAANDNLSFQDAFHVRLANAELHLERAGTVALEIAEGDIAWHQQMLEKDPHESVAYCRLRISGIGIELSPPYPRFCEKDRDEGFTSFEC